MTVWPPGQVAVPLVRGIKRIPDRKQQFAVGRIADMHERILGIGNELMAGRHDIPLFRLDVTVTLLRVRSREDPRAVRIQGRPIDLEFEAAEGEQLASGGDIPETNRCER